MQNRVLQQNQNQGLTLKGSQFAIPIIRRLTRILAHFSKAASSQAELQSLLANVLAEMTELLDSEVCSIFLNDSKNTDIIKCVAGSGFAEDLVGKAEYKSGEGFTGTIFRNGETVIIRSGDELQQRSDLTGWVGKYDKLQWRAFGGKSQFRNCIASPLKIGDESIGIIKVENKHGGEFTVEDLRILEAISNGVLSLALHNARLLHRE